MQEDLRQQTVETLLAGLARMVELHKTAQLAAKDAVAFFILIAFFFISFGLWFPLCAVIFYFYFYLFIFVFFGFIII